MLKGVYRHSGGSVHELPIARRLAASSSAQFSVEDRLAVASDTVEGPATLGAVKCILEGHLYEPITLARELGSEGASDAELIAHGYRCYGEDVLTRLRGRFALALWDDTRRRGFLACDLLSAQPLFFSLGSGYLAFAGELPDLLSMLPSSPGPDSIGFLSKLGGCPVPPDRTLFEGVFRLEPGHLVELDGDSATRVYWQPRYDGTSKGSRQELADGLREEIGRAVARRLSQRSCGVVLSGGVDSSIVTAEANAVRPPGHVLQTYSAVFPGEAYDERWKVESLAAALGIEPQLFELAPQGALWLALMHAKRWRMPLAGPAAAIDVAMVAAAGNDGIEVVLDGQTGDELFGCSPWLIADRLLHGRPFAALDLARELPGQPTNPRALLYIVKHLGLRGAAPHRLHGWLRNRKGGGDLGPGWLLPRCRSRLSSLVDPWAWKASASGPRWWRFQADRLVRAPHRELRLDYLRSRASDAGVRGETPLYDFDLIDYCLRLPPELAFDPSLNRPLAREAMRGVIPDEVRLSGKKADISPLCFDMISGADAPGIERLIMAPDAEIGAYADMEKVRELWRSGRPKRESTAMAAAWSAQIWQFVATECWLRRQADSALLDEMLAAPDVPRPSARRAATGSRSSTFLEPTFSGLAEA